jgi:dihydroflavonol-4-reductase
VIPEPILVTGAAGFLGHRLTQELTRRGLTVRALVRPGHDATRLKAFGAGIVRADLEVPSQVAAAVDGCATVFHLGAARGHSKLSRRAYIGLNRGQAEIIGRASLAAGIRRLVFTSTARVACRDQAWSDETTSPSPISGYRESKLRAEDVLLELGSQGLNVVIARLPMVMGPGAVDWKRDFLKVRSGRLRYLPAGGVTHIGDVDDMISGLCLCADVPDVEGERFLLASAQPLAVRDLYRAIAEAVGVPLSVRELPGFPFRAYAAAARLVYRTSGWALPFGFTCERLAARHRFRIDKARALLGFAPRWETRATVNRTADWMREKGWLPIEARQER